MADEKRRVARISSSAPSAAIPAGAIVAVRSRSVALLRAGYGLPNNIKAAPKGKKRLPISALEEMKLASLNARQFLIYQ